MPSDADAQAAIARWAESGLALLGGASHSPPAIPPRDYVGRIIELLERLSGHGIDAPLELMSARAVEMGLRRNGAISAGGNARILPTCSGHIAVSLARNEDVELVPAWL